MNVIIQSSKWVPRDLTVVFNGEPVEFASATTLPELLVELGIYKSNTEAKRAGRVGPVPRGLSEIRASKKVPDLWVWNPDS